MSPATATATARSVAETTTEEGSWKTDGPLAALLPSLVLSYDQFLFSAATSFRRSLPGFECTRTPERLLDFTMVMWEDPTFGGWPSLTRAACHAPQDLLRELSLALRKRVFLDLLDPPSSSSFFRLLEAIAIVQV